MSTAAPSMPSIADFVAANPNAPPSEMLRVVMAETERLKLQADLVKEEAAIRQQEWREETEVSLDENLNFKPKTLAQLQRLARMFAESGMVPDHYAVSNPQEYHKKVAACAIAVQMALRCRVDVMTFLQSSYVVYGKPGIEGKLVISMLNSSGQIKGRVEFEPARGPDGKIIACRAFATDVKSGKEVSETVTWDMVVAEGWDKDKKGQKSKWVTLPDVMFKYRSATFLGRVHFPDVLMGMYTIDELDEIGRLNGDANGAAAAAGDLTELSERIGAAPKSAQPAKRPRHVAEPKPSETESAKEPAAETAPPKTDPQPPKTPPKKAAAAETKPASPASTALPTKETAPPKQPTGPVGTAPASSTAPQQPRKSPSMTPEGLKSYMRMRWEDDCGSFDMDRLSAIASGQPNPMGFIDLIISRNNPNWQNFIARESESGELAQEPVDDGQPAEDASQVEAGNTEPGETEDEHPKCISHPLPRPSMEMTETAFELERQIIGKRNPQLILEFASSQIKGHPDLSDREVDYLVDLAERRAWQLDNNVATTDRPGRTLPGLEK